MVDRLKAFHEASLRLHEAIETLWLAEQTLLAAKRASERTREEYKAAQDALEGNKFRIVGRMADGE